MAFFFPWTYYFSNRRIPPGIPGTIAISPDLTEEMAVDMAEVWPYPNLVNMTTDEIGSGEESTTVIPSTSPFPITDELNQWGLNFIMHGVLLPMIIILGILTNLACLIVLTRRPMRSVLINIYLSALSAFDAILLITVLFLHPPWAYCQMYATDASYSWCQFFSHTAPIAHPLIRIMQTASIWTLAAVTIDRFLSIGWPQAREKWYTNRRAVIMCLLILVGSIFYNLPSFFELRLFEYPTSVDENGKPTDFVWILNRSEMAAKAWYTRIYKGYCYICFIFLFPVSIMLALLGYTILDRIGGSNRRPDFSTNISWREANDRRCLVLVVSVIGKFLIFNLIGYIINILDGFWSEDKLSRSYILTLAYMGNAMVAVNSATNLVLYYFLGLRFRQIFCKLFCCYCYTSEREYQFLSLYYESGRKYCWTEGGGPREENGDDDGASNGIVAMKTMPSIRRPQHRSTGPRSQTPVSSGDAG